ncbi:agmatinase [Peristeroidobacter agariperforans]|uniref:agmatinase n=1 Tax=Peristeroidobacter agariperforans TaxID=268404 RepID=UPI00101CAA67|nr:agmatinase [Peristeroidobacter agariperforans]
MTKIALLGVPHDENSSYLRGPAEAPDLIRRELHNDAYSLWSESGVDLSAPGRLVDLGNIRFEGDRDPWDLIEQCVGEALASGDPLICLGGDHAVTYPIMRGVRRHHRSLTILHIDAHADIYHAYQDNPRSHASPFARIMEEKLTDRLIQVGLRTICDEHRQQFKRFNVEVIEAGRWSDCTRLELTTPVYISLDIDGLDPAFAPGVSHREPGGPSPRQVIDLIQSIRQPIVGADIVEYNPRCDISNQTTLVAAKMVKEIAGMMVKNRA